MHRYLVPLQITANESKGLLDQVIDVAKCPYSNIFLEIRTSSLDDYSRTVPVGRNLLERDRGFFEIGRLTKESSYLRELSSLSMAA